MFSNESKGEVFPGRFKDVKNAYDPDGMSYWSVVDHVTIYPEYMTDMNILICPSDNTLPPDPWDAPGTGYWRAVNSSWTAYPHGGPIPSLAAVGANDTACRDKTTTAGCYVRWLDDSYTYWGWAVKGEYAATAADVIELGNTLDDSGLGSGPVVTNAGEYGDIGDVPLTGGPTTLYWFREGIERFFISDINNAAASSLAQSELAVMWDSSRIQGSDDDNPGAVSDEYNHVPGGANVLFMDGHVAFFKYPQPDGSDAFIVTRAATQDDYMWYP